MSKEKLPKIAPSFKSSKEIRTGVNPESNRDKYPAWQIGLIDVDGIWGWKNIAGMHWWESICSKLKNFESMTWQQIYDATGGRSQGNNNHEIPREMLNKDARKRLKELGYDDIDTLFSLRLSGTERIWGLLQGNILKIIWYDPNHQVCSTKK